MCPYFRDVEIHVTRQMEDLSTSARHRQPDHRDRCTAGALRQSVVQRKFAAWAAILAFPTAVAGIYGMNFQNMPELQWHYGYFAVLGFIATGCTGLWAASSARGGCNLPTPTAHSQATCGLWATKRIIHSATVTPWWSRARLATPC